MQNPKELLMQFRQAAGLKLIAITGGPCGGKSTFLKMAIALLQKHGFKVVVVSEVARELIASGLAPWDPKWKTSIAFQRQVFLGILTKEYWLLQSVTNMDLDGQQVVFLCDRGYPDGMAYSGEDQFIAMLSNWGLKLTDVLDHYAGVIHMLTAAHGAEEFYVTDAERMETPEQARERDDLLRNAWLQHQHQIVVDNSGAFSDKINRALEALRRILKMPTPQEIEVKFRVYDFSLGQVPGDAKFYNIEQTYLERPDRPGIECRVRKREVARSSSYFYTEKTSTDVVGVRAEHEEIIDETHYNAFIAAWKKPGTCTVFKTRYKFHHGSSVAELDVYQGNLKGLVMLEIELPNVEAMGTLALPGQFKLVDKTADKRYSNASLAEHGIPEE